MPKRKLKRRPKPRLKRRPEPRQRLRWLLPWPRLRWRRPRLAPRRNARRRRLARTPRRIRRRSREGSRREEGGHRRRGRRRRRQGKGDRGRFRPRTRTPRGGADAAAPNRARAPVPKICFLCEKDCSSEPRQRDDAGRYAHLTCVQIKLRQQQDRAKAKAEAAAEAIAPGYGSAPPSPRNSAPSSPPCSNKRRAATPRSDPITRPLARTARVEAAATVRGAPAPSSANSSAPSSVHSSPTRRIDFSPSTTPGIGKNAKVNVPFFQNLAEVAAAARKETRYGVPNTPRHAKSGGGSMPATPAAAAGGGRGVDGGEAERRARSATSTPRGKRDDDVPDMDIDARPTSRRTGDARIRRARRRIARWSPRRVARTSSSKTRRRSCSACTSAARARRRRTRRALRLLEPPVFPQGRRRVHAEDGGDGRQAPAVQVRHPAGFGGGREPQPGGVPLRRHPRHHPKRAQPVALLLLHRTRGGAQTHPKRARVPGRGRSRGGDVERTKARGGDGGCVSRRKRRNRRKNIRGRSRRPVAMGERRRKRRRVAAG